MGRKAFLLLTLAVALAIAAGAAWRGAQPPRVAVTYASPSRGPISREVLTSGTLQPTREVEVGAQVSGTVQSIHADFNDRVTAGQIIAQLDPSTYDAAVAQARGREIQAAADVEARQVVLDDATTKVARARELRGQDLITQAELDAAELAVRQAQADVIAATAAAKSARAGLAAAEVDRSHTTIRSPIDGVVVNRSVEVGQTLASRVQAPVLFRIADLRHMQMLTEIGEAEVGSVRQGTEVSFEIESLGSRQFRGTVAEVRLAPILQAASGGSTSGSGNAPAAATGTTGAAATPGATATTGTTSAAGTPPATGTTPAGSPAAGTTSGGSTTAAAPAGAVVSYTAIVNVDNREYAIAPGTTAIVLLPTAQRKDVLRVPNNALSFRPSPGVLEATGQSGPSVAPTDRVEEPADPARGRAGYLWQFENGKFTPVAVRTGVSDEAWTEILSGPVQPGGRFVTSATAR
jgi:RND family efflux transporter MFP subunit